MCCQCEPPGRRPHPRHYLARHWKTSPPCKSLAAKLLHPSEPDAIRLAVIQMLRQKKDNDIAKLLLDAWPTLTPAASRSRRPSARVPHRMDRSPAHRRREAADQTLRDQPHHPRQPAATHHPRACATARPSSSPPAAPAPKCSRSISPRSRSKAMPTPDTSSTRPPAPSATAKAPKAATSARTSPPSWPGPTSSSSPTSSIPTAKSRQTSSSTPWS